VSTLNAGDVFFYCYELSNTGDTVGIDLEITDEQLGYITSVDMLSPGDSLVYVSDAQVAEQDLSTVASVVGFDEFGFELLDSDASVLNVQYTDLAVDVSAPSMLVTSSSGKTLTYTITVTNLGEATALDSLLTDELPEGLSFVGISASTDSISCTDSSGMVVCELGEVAPGEVITLTLTTTVTTNMVILTNSVFVENTVADSDASNNQDSTATRVAPGATRTIGFYSTHPAFVQSCLDANGGQIDLGFVLLKDEAYDNEIDAGAGNPDTDTDRETAHEMAMGILKANVDKFRDNSKRTALQKARMQAGRQLFAAICNSSYLGATPSFSISSAVNTLKGTDSTAILTVSSKADTFNNSGDSIDVGISTGAANSSYPYDDPTDKRD
jgi:uncharacterized repeat protein (TIGR01451 family)